MVRGHHAVLSPVQLPLWTSDDMMEKMVHRYEQRLIEQIKYMMSSESEAEGRSRANSLQSNPGLSTDGSNETSAQAIRGYPQAKAAGSSKPSDVDHTKWYLFLSIILFILGNPPNLHVTYCVPVLFFSIFCHPMFRTLSPAA